MLFDILQKIIVLTVGIFLLLGVIIMILRYKNVNPSERKEIFKKAFISTSGMPAFYENCIDFE